MTPLQLPLLNQIWDSLLSMKDAVVTSSPILCPPGTPENVTEFHALWGLHRYTRLTGRLASC